MRNILLGLITTLMILSCSKEEKETNTSKPILSKGEISYNLDGIENKGSGGAYNFSDTAYFVKYENAQSQLSINFNDTKTGALPVGTHTFEKRKSYLSYFPDFTGEQFTSTSGQVSIDKIEGSLISGTFSGTLVRKSDGNKIEITNGRFHQIAAPRI